MRLSKFINKLLERQAEFEKLGHDPLVWCHIEISGKDTILLADIGAKDMNDAAFPDKLQPSIIIEP